MVHQVFKEAVTIEQEFITQSIPCNMIGMNKELMCQYIEYVADRLLNKLKLPPIYNSENPFEFMELISLQGKSNFFESRPTEYQNAHVLNQNKSFTLEEDF
jgi:ribonucleoside-diphosphate reductase beta chain